jgi:hypothetical protein
VSASGSPPRFCRRGAASRLAINGFTDADNHDALTLLRALRNEEG